MNVMSSYWYTGQSSRRPNGQAMPTMHAAKSTPFALEALAGVSSSKSSGHRKRVPLCTFRSSEGHGTRQFHAAT